jgi:hypothetical protein
MADLLVAGAMLLEGSEEPTKMCLTARHQEVGPGQGYRSDREPLGDAKKSVSAGSTTMSYLAACLIREHPEIAAAVERGEYRTVGVPRNGSSSIST